MTEHTQYRDFIANVGLPVTELYPGDKDKRALTIKEALLAIEILSKTNMLIVGGDVLSTNENDVLRYAHHCWGDRYVYLDWSISHKLPDESNDDYMAMSYEKAKKSIAEADNVARKIKRECYIVLYA